MNRRRVRSTAYRIRRQKRHAGRHVFIDEPLECSDCVAGLPHSGPCVSGSRVTEYRRGQVVSVDIDPGVGGPFD
jgi:hypothetical protein